MKFTDGELDVIASALSVAAEVYKCDADISKDETSVSQQFLRQKAQCEELRQKIDER